MLRVEMEEYDKELSRVRSVKQQIMARYSQLSKASGRRPRRPSGVVGAARQ